MSQFLIIRAGKTFIDAAKKFGEFDKNFLDAFTSPPNNYNVIDAQDPEDYPTVNNLNGVLITGALENVTEQKDWMIKLKQFIITCHNASLPLLGICFGHQIIADALGGKADFNEKGGEFGICSIELTKPFDLFGFNFPNRFDAYLTHFQSVATLPDGAVSYAKSEKENNQIVHFGKETWGFQFHPEFTRPILQFYLNEMNIEGNTGTELNGKQIEAFGSAILDTFVSYCEH